MDVSREAEWPSILRTWASLGNFRAVRSQPVPDWIAITGMIETVGPAMEAKASYLRSLLDKCRTKLDPLGEPLNLDLGLHRWLNAEREETYSDWLEWVVQQAKAPSRVFRLFGLEPPSSLTDDAPLDVKREVCIPHGHEDQEGRLDLVISFGGQAAIIVEVKKGDADDTDTAKHAGYTESHSNAKRVLLAVSADELDYEGFEFRSWANVCIEMRLLAMELCKDRNTLAAAMVLAFVAAVEQNLLGFSAVSEKLVFVNSFVVDHIKHFLEKVDR